MADRTRAFDWGSTAVGPIEAWPETLLIAVNTLLASWQPMFLWWGDDLIQFYNDAYRPSIGNDKHPHALGQKGRECWPEIWPIIGPQIEQVMTRGEATWHENQLVPIHRDGKLEDVYWTYGYSPVWDLSGAIRGTLVTCTETTRAQMTEMSLRQELQRMADLFHQSPAFFAVLRGPEHVFEMANPPYEKLMGGRDMIGRSVREAVPEVEGQGFLELLNGVYQTGEPYVGRGVRIRLARPGSGELEERTLDFVYQPLRETDGTISGIIAFGVDMTESRHAERLLIQSEKLAAVGRLASSIAHEINNPLEAVTNLLYLAQQSAVNPKAKEYLATAEIELRRVAAITNQTLRFYRQSSNPRYVTAKELIDNTLPLYQGRLNNSKVTVEKRERMTQPVMCLDGEIRQVLSNLIGNAIDAMQISGGRLLLRSREGTDWKTGRKGMVLTVADTGTGLSKSVQARLFEPFFTTKGMNGTGLGLWISQEIVERHGGMLRVRSSQSEKYSGSVFTCFLPCETEIR